MSTEINPNLSESPKNILKVLEETLPPISNNSKSKSDIINQILLHYKFQQNYKIN